jgi:hypothetical protein
MKFAIVDQSNNVVNVVICDMNWPVDPEMQKVEVLEGEVCFIGQDFDANANPRFSGNQPSTPQSWTAYQFLLRFTAEERAAFRAAAITDPNVADFQQLAQAAQEVVSDDPMTVAGMAYLVSVGLLTSARRDEILGG